MPMRDLTPCPQCGVQAWYDGIEYKPAIFPRMCVRCRVEDNYCPTCDTSLCTHPKPYCDVCGDTKCNKPAKEN